MLYSSVFLFQCGEKLEIALIADNESVKTRASVMLRSKMVLRVSSMANDSAVNIDADFVILYLKLKLKLGE